MSAMDALLVVIGMAALSAVLTIPLLGPGCEYHTVPGRSDYPAYQACLDAERR